MTDSRAGDVGQAEGEGQGKAQAGEMVGRELDAWVAAEIMGDPFVKPRHGTCCTCQKCGKHYDDCGDGCDYSTDIRSAWEVVEKMAERGYDCELHMISHLGVVAYFRDYEAPRDAPPNGKAVVDPREGAAPLAICLAARRALATDSEGGET